MATFSINLKDGSVETTKPLIVGIDLGTTNSLVAFIKDGQPYCVKGADGRSTLVPSVLHFAENQVHFEQMFGELIRVLRPGGSLFIRTATDVGLADKMIPLGDGRFWLPDESERYLLTRPLLDTLIAQHKLIWLEPFKTVLVEDVRSMAVVVLGKT